MTTLTGNEWYISDWDWDVELRVDPVTGRSYANAIEREQEYYASIHEKVEAIVTKRETDGGD